MAYEEASHAINWTALTAQHGTPLLLAEFKAVCSADKEIADEAIETIVDSTAHQHTRYPCSPESVPFLVELLREPTAAPTRRGDIAAVLTLIAIGSDLGSVPAGLPLDELQRSVTRLPENRRRVDENAYVWEQHSNGRKVEQSVIADARTYWALAAYEAAERAVPDLLPLLDDAEQPIRLAVTYLLGWFPRRADLVVPALRARWEREDDPAVTAMLALALGMAAGESHEPQDIARATRLVAGAEPLARWGAAVALARMLGRDAPGEAVAELIAWTCGGRTKLDVPPLPFISNTPLAVAAAALPLTSVGTVTGAQSDEKALDALCINLLLANADGAYDVIDTLLQAAFPAGPVSGGTPYAGLTSTQQRVVAAAALAKGPWQTGDFSRKLATYGLHFPEQGVLQSAGLAPGCMAILGHPDRMGLLEYAGLREWQTMYLETIAGVPSEAKAKVELSCPKPWFDRLMAQLEAALDDGYDYDRLDAYVDEHDYRESVDRWFQVTEEFVAHSVSRSEYRVERQGKLLLTVTAHPFAAVATPETTWLHSSSPQ